jgi:hypothetical protein
LTADSYYARILDRFQKELLTIYIHISINKVMNQDPQNYNNQVPSNLPTGESKEKVEITRETTAEPAPERGASTAVKALAIVGIILLVFIGLYATAKVVSNVPNAARGLASGFVSVTSQFFGADEGDEDEDENADEDPDGNDDSDESVSDGTGDEEDDEGDDDENGDDTSTGGTATTGGGTTVTPPPTYTVVNVPGSGTVTSDPNGEVDLRVSLVALGTSDNIRGDDFTETDNFDEDDYITIKFEVRNIGTKTSDDWEYEAKLPTSPSYTYDSKEQDGLRPGDRIEFTLTFEDPSDRKNEIVITVDPDDDTDDDNRSNNRLVVDVEIDD